MIAFKKAGNKIDLIYLNSIPAEFKGRVELKKYSIDEGTVSEINLNGFQNVHIFTEEKVVITSLADAVAEDSVLLATLFNEKDELISRNYYLKGEWKHKRFPNFQNEFTINLVESQRSLIISTEQTAFFVMLQHPQLQFSDNGFILLAGERKKLQIDGDIPYNFDMNEIMVFSLNQYLD